MDQARRAVFEELGVHLVSKPTAADFVRRAMEYVTYEDYKALPRLSDRRAELRRAWEDAALDEIKRLITDDTKRQPLLASVANYLVIGRSGALHITWERTSQSGWSSGGAVLADDMQAYS